MNIMRTFFLPEPDGMLGCVPSPYVWWLSQIYDSVSSILVYRSDVELYNIISLIYCVIIV
jgi:hypothetical protein